MDYTSSPLYFLRKCFSFLLQHLSSHYLSDIILWPVYRRIFGRGYQEIVSPYPGLKMRIYGDMPDMVNKVLLFMSDRLQLAWEPVTARFVASIAPQIKSVIVAGSHIGYYPLIISAINSKVHVYACEPDPLNFERLTKNVSLNNFKNIHIIPVALGDKVGKQKMYFDAGQSSLLDTDRGKIKQGIVSVQTLDDLCGYEKIKPDLIILDAEGYEQYIIQGALNTISSFHPDIIFELNPRSLRVAGSSPEKLESILLVKGYTLFIIEDNYSHRMNNTDEPIVKFSSYVPEHIKDISFVNAYATIYPERVKKYYVNSG